MPVDHDFPSDGGCTCKAVRYRMESEPLFVHCCHCRWCQRETGSAFALNAMIEADRVSLLQGRVETVMTPSNSGKGQTIARCPECRVALWSNYAGAGDAIRFVRVGTLTIPTCCRPIFTSLPSQSSRGSTCLAVSRPFPNTTTGRRSGRRPASSASAFSGLGPDGAGISTLKPRRRRQHLRPPRHQRQNPQSP